MTSTVNQLYKSQSLLYKGPIHLADLRNAKLPSCNGIYVVSTSNDPKSARAMTITLDDSRLEAWLQTANEMTLDGERPTVRSLRQYLRMYWHENENILYIGKAGCNRGLQIRLHELAKHGGLGTGRHKLGRRSPHAGGHWLYALQNIDDCFLYYSHELGDKHELTVETRMLETFILNRGGSDLIQLPWANLELKCANQKNLQLVYGRKQNRLRKPTRK